MLAERYSVKWCHKVLNAITPEQGYG